MTQSTSPDSGTAEQKINPATGQPYPPMGIPVSTEVPEDDPITENPDEIAGERVYLSLSWMNVTKDEAMTIRDAALAAAPQLSSFSVSYSTPITEDD